MWGEGSRSISLDLYTYGHTLYGEDSEAREMPSCCVVTADVNPRRPLPEAGLGCCRGPVPMTEPSAQAWLFPLLRPAQRTPGAGV